VYFILFICVAEGEGGEVGGAGVRVHSPGLEYQTNLLGLQVFLSCCYTHFAPKCTTIYAISRQKIKNFWQGQASPLPRPTAFTILCLKMKLRLWMYTTVKILTSPILVFVYSEFGCQ